MVRKRRRSNKKQDIEQQPKEVSAEKQAAIPEKVTKDTKGSETTTKVTTAKTSTKRKDSIGERIKMFFKEVRAELKKVSWPDRERTTHSTLVVIFTLVVLALCMTLFTVIFTRLADYFFKIPTVTG